MIALPLPDVSDPLRHGVSDNAGLNLWAGRGVIYVKGG
jgi:hypothetical protein